MTNGTSKALYSLKYGVDMIDGCILGYGRGSGNAKTELIIMNLNKKLNREYDFIHIIEFGDMNLVNYKECTVNSCYNVVYALASYFGCHVTYAIEIIEKYEKMNIRDIYRVFEELKKNKKNMFHWKNLFIEMYEKKYSDIV
jgi:4-hydroxy 2-oxovalerate aldolase